jgi:stage II sporulation protein M
VLSEAIFGMAFLGMVVDLEKTSWIKEAAAAIGASDYATLGSLLTARLFVETAALFVVPAAVVTLAVVVLAGGFVYSAEYGSYWKALDGAHVGIPEVMTAFRERWRPMAWTFLLSYLVTLGPLIVAVPASAAILLSSTEVAALVGAVSLLSVATVLTLILSSMLVYTPVAVVAENLSGWAAISRSLRLSRRNYGVTLTYGVVYVLLTGALTAASSLIPEGGLPISSLVTVGVLILVTPVLHMSKTRLFQELDGPEVPPYEFLPPFSSDLKPMLGSLWSRFLTGLGELKRFALDPANLPFHALSALAMVLGWYAGLYVGQNGVTQLIYGMGYTAGKINPLVSESLPFSLGVYIFFHNWQVSLATALSGVWFSAAPFITLFLNGVLIGVVASLVPNTNMLLAALLPHGIIELPSFVLAGSAGIKLGVTFLRSVRSDDPTATAEFHSVARQSVYIVVGLALLFLVAGLIEGNLTPVIMKMAGWS